MSRPLFLRKLRKYVAALPALAFGFVASPAFSTVVNVNASGITAGSSSATFTGGTLTATGGVFTKTTTTGTNPTTVVGLSGGFVNDEVDVSGEKLTLNFGATAAVVSQITIGLLFRSGVNGNLIDEAVQMQTNGGTSCASGSFAFCILSATGVWRGTPTGVTVVSPGTAGNGGIFTITNPFGSELINSIDFLPWNIAGSGAANSDFSLVSVTYTTTAIPEPGTLALLGSGLIGIAIAGRRRELR